MYLEEIPENIFTTTKVKVKYDCCGKEHELKWKDADKNFHKNNQKHICRSCWLINSNPAKRTEVKEKTRKTNIEKYGAPCALNTKENTEKRVKAMFEDKDNFERIMSKRKETNLEKYGTEHAIASEQVRDKIKDTFIERYGVDNPQKIQEIKEKTQETNLERYGNKCTLHAIEIKPKIINTMLEKYGVEYYNQLPEMKDYLRENCRDWLKESWESGGPAKGVARPKEWNEKQSKTVSQMIVGGKWKGGDNKGKIVGFYESNKHIKGKTYYRSSLELKMNELLDKDDEVEYYDTEPFSIEYQDNDGILRRYIPDFLVKYKDNDILTLIEVKPEYLLDYTHIKRKCNAAIEYVKENGMIFETWTEKDLRK